MNFLDKLKNSGKSLTIWFNTTLLTVFPVIEYLKDMLPQIQEFLTPDIYKVVGLTVVLVNIVLRFRTTKCLADK